MFAAFVIVSIVLTLFLIVSFIYKYHNDGRRSTTIPGPPLVNLKTGHLDDMKQAGGMHDYLTLMHRKYGDIVAFWMGTQMVVSIASPDRFKENMGAFDRPAFLFEFDEPLVGRASIQFANGAEGKRRRALYDKSFSHNACRIYQDEFQKISEELIDTWAKTPKEEHIPLRRHMMAVALKSITRTCFDHYFRDEQSIIDFTNLYDKAMDAMNDRMSDTISDQQKQRKHHLQEVEGFKSEVKKLINYREENGPESEEKKNFLDVLLDTTTDKDIMVCDAVTYIFGGFHTSGNFLTWALYFIACHHDVQEKLYQEITKVLGEEPFSVDKTNDMAYTRQVLDETIRAAVIGPFAARSVETDSNLGGHIIPANTPVVHALGVVFKTEKYWPEPDKFDPERFSPENIHNIPKMAFEPFGFAGKRKCPGYRFVYTEAIVVISSLIRKFVIHLVSDEPPIPVHGFVTRPKEEIWITLEKREVTNC